MNRIERFFCYGLIGSMAIYIFFLQTCNGSSNKGSDLCNSSVVNIDIQKQPRYFPVYKPYPVEVIIPGPSTIDSIPYTDSNYCKQLAIDHFTMKVYNDTLNNDTIDIWVNDTVMGNELLNRGVSYKIKKPFITVVNDRFQVFASGNIGTDLKGFVAGPEIILKDKRGFLYKAGVDFNTSGTITYRLGFGFLIRLKKRPKLTDVIK